MHAARSDADWLAAVVPALNEAPTIAYVVENLTRVADRVYVVDDGSTDGTGEAASIVGATIVRNEKPAGYDAAIAAGINLAFADGATAVVTCDADGQHRAADVLRIAEPILRGEADFATGLRNRYNRRVEALIGFVARRVFGTRDPFCGLKCYSRTLYELTGPFPAEMHIGTLPLRWVRDFQLRAAFLEITVEAREDAPRFGRRFWADLKLLRAFTATLTTAAPRR